MDEHLPQLSVWPVVVGFAILLIAAGLLATFILTIVGVILLLFALWNWSQENRLTGQEHGVSVEVEAEKRYE